LITLGDIMQCDICGKTTRVFLTDMEGAKIYVCSLCNPSGEGKIIRPRIEHSNNFVRKPIPQFKMRKQEPFDLNNYDLVEDYAEQIKKLREANKKTYDEFAKDLYVTASYLQKVEQDKLKPSAGLLLKLYEKYNLLLINRKQGIEAKELPQKRDFHHKEFVKKEYPKKDFKQKFNKDFKQRERHNDFILREEKLTTPKEIYAPEEQKGETFESVNHNNKKKIIFS